MEEPKGFLLKPDFKRKEQHVGAGGKKLINSVRSIHFRMPGASTYRPRWFVLDGITLRYYKAETDEIEAGSIHLANVNAILPSRVSDAPEHALDLVCADRIYTIAANTREDLVRWATVLTLVLQGKFRPKNSRRRESTSGLRSEQSATSISRRGSMVSVKSNCCLSDDMLTEARDNTSVVQIVTVTFEDVGPLGIIFQETVNNEVIVVGFKKSKNGNSLLAVNALMIDDALISVNDEYFSCVTLERAVGLLKTSPRPITLRFMRVSSLSSIGRPLAAEGWVLVREPGI